MSGTGSLLAIGLLLAVVQDRPTVESLPVIDRQRENFYHALAAGPKGVEATWLVTPTTVPIDGELSLTLIVANAANPKELVKPPLDKFEAFTALFQVFLDADAPPETDAHEVRFRYRLRPRSLDVTSIPSLKYLYYRMEGGMFYTTYARSVEIKVAPPVAKATPVAAVVPLEGPEEFFQLAEDGALLSPPTFLTIAFPILTVPIVVVVWIGLWHRLFPNAVRLAKLRRNRAARRALDRLNGARSMNDPIAITAHVLREYLTSRFALPSSAQTPNEIASGIEDSGVRTSSFDFFRACDAARFSTERDTGLSLVVRAEGLIAEWEGAAA